jgi:hypothetical protein
MGTPVIILLVGLAYVVLFGGIGLLRREGLSLRFAIESICITAVFSGLAALTGAQVDPILFLIVLYLITMRVRILIDLGVMIARQGKTALAAELYALPVVYGLTPPAVDPEVNQATLLLQEAKLNEIDRNVHRCTPTGGPGLSGGQV